MKLIAFLSRLALAGFAAFILGLAFAAQPLALFACAMGVAFLLIVASDYAPRAHGRVAVAATVIDFPTTLVRAENHDRIAA